MKIIQDPVVYGQQAQLGLFISMEDFKAFPALLVALQKKTELTLAKAESTLDYFKGIHDSGEASSRQCTLMDKWQEKCERLDFFNNTLIKVEDILEKGEKQ